VPFVLAFLEHAQGAMQTRQPTKPLGVSGKSTSTAAQSVMIVEGMIVEGMIVEGMIVEGRTPTSAQGAPRARG
jgi:hypothetical protein